MDEAFRVPDELHDRTVEKVLARVSGRGRDQIARLLRLERVRHDEQPVLPGTRLPAGSEILVLAPDRRPKKILPNRKLRLHVLHRDDHLLVVKKPAGLAMHPGPGHGSDTLLNAVLALAGEPLQALGAERSYGLVHRLDRGTSGVVIVALTAEAYDGIVEQFKERAVEKEYVAFVRGGPGQEQGTVEDPVGGKEAETSYSVTEVREGEAGVASRLTVHPKTGRTHQIRIHLASLGCPVIGDRRYGEEDDPLARALYVPHLALHARAIAVRHPITGERAAFEAPLPGSLRRAWGKYGTKPGS